MATIKSYTDLEQSKKLTEILSLDSADMYYMETSPNNYTVGVLQRLERDMLLNQSEYYKMFPCWSLTALLNVLPNGIDIIKEEADTENERYMCTIGINDDIISTFANNPVDACVAMIEKLHNLKML